MLTPSDHGPPLETEVFDASEVASDLERLAKVHAGNPRELRLEVARRIKAALVQGRAAAEDLLIKDRHAGAAPSAVLHAG